METEQDIVYINKILNGDREAYAYLVNKYKAMVFTLALRIVKNREEAEEIAQDVFVKAYQSLATFKGKAKFSSWLYKIVYNAAISSLRKPERRHIRIDESNVSETLYTESKRHHESLSLDERKKYIGYALDRLDEDERFFIILYYFEERDLDEIAEISGLTKTNTKVRLFRARKKMLTVLERYLKEEIHSLL